MNSSSMVYPYPTLWVSQRVKINFFCKLLFGEHHWCVDSFFYIYHMTSFSYYAKDTREAGLSCRCHLSNSPLVCSVQVYVHKLLLLLLCFLIPLSCFYIYLFVFVIVTCFFLFLGYFTEYLCNWSRKV